MGMAASQARFLGLTARKSNVEYQVQQINQQRTALANESAGLYNQMMELSVPTPPSANAFYKTNYVLDDTAGYGNSNFKIANMNNTYDNSNYPYILSVTREVKTKHNCAFNYVLNSRSETEATLSNSANGGVSFTLTKKTDNDGWPLDEEGKISIRKNYVYTIPDPNATYDDEDKKTTAQSIIDSIDGYELYKDGAGENGEPYTYFYKGEDGKNYFLTQSDYDQLFSDEAINDNKSSIGFDGYTITTEEEPYEVRANIVKSSSGRITNVVIADDNAYPAELGGKELSVSMEQEYDEAGYDEAMNDYVYEKDQYEKMISDINAKTETIQAKDKSLELKIKQLDTEQNAIQTEMDSVQKVVETNVEKTFNIFG